MAVELSVNNIVGQDLSGRWPLYLSGRVRKNYQTGRWSRVAADFGWPAKTGWTLCTCCEIAHF